MATRESARREGRYLTVSDTPDVCRTPPNNAPIPYTVVADLGEAVSASPNVFYQGFPLILADESRLPSVTGDEAGSGGGIRSGTHRGWVKFVEGVISMLVNRRNPVGNKLRVECNNGNCTGRVLCQARPMARPVARKKGRPTLPENQVRIETWVVQATSMIQRDTVKGPAWVRMKPPFLLPPYDAITLGTYQGDGANRTFDDSNSLDEKSARIKVDFEIQLFYEFGKVKGIGTANEHLSPSFSTLLKPEYRKKENPIDFGLDGIFVNHVAAMAALRLKAKDSLAPAQKLVPYASVEVVIKFSLDGEYWGMKGSVSAYPWAQVRCFRKQSLRDNVKHVPKHPDNPASLLLSKVGFQSGYWK